MKTLRIKHKKYDKYMDKAMIPLCDVLNSMPGITTTESCEGHGKWNTDVVFVASDFVSLAKIQRAVDRRYCGLKKEWEIVCSTIDIPPKGHPPMVFFLTSKEPYLKSERMTLLRDLGAICLNLKLYHTDYFNNYFQHPRRKYSPVPNDIWQEHLKEWESNNKMYLGRSKEEK